MTTARACGIILWEVPMALKRHIVVFISLLLVAACVPKKVDEEQIAQIESQLKSIFLRFHGERGASELVLQHLILYVVEAHATLGRQ